MKFNVEDMVLKNLCVIYVMMNCSIASIIETLKRYMHIFLI